MRRSGSVLVVDDSPVERELIVASLNAAGLHKEIRTVQNGAEAIAYLSGEGMFSDREAHPYPCFVLTDLKMPVADGFAVLEYMRARPDLAIIPTVVFSGSADPDDVKTAYQLGASSYLVKPSTSEGLRKCLQTLYDYWTMCEVPAAQPSGESVKTESRGKLGERFTREPFPSQRAEPPRS
mgnify:CR=1 FL=1|jgi:FOG: CheY-like receiver